MPETDIDKLRSWASKTDAELKSEYSEGHHSLANLLMLLGDRKLQQDQITEKTFVPIVRQLERLLRSGSRALGDALNDAGECKDRGDLAEAKRILETFIRSCPSKFYTDIARNYIDRHLT